MVTVQDVPLSDFWQIWDDADPHTWSPNDDTGAAWPQDRMEDAADNLTPTSYGTEHDNAKIHGLDH